MKATLRILVMKLIGLKPILQNRDYPYTTVFGELTHNQANSIYHYLWFGWELKAPSISPSTKVIVDKSSRNPCFESFTVHISEFVVFGINP